MRTAIGKQCNERRVWVFANISKATKCVSGTMQTEASSFGEVGAFQATCTAHTARSAAARLFPGWTHQPVCELAVWQLKGLDGGVPPSLLRGGLQ